MKFKVTDKVKVAQNGRFNGRTGEVLEIHNGLDLETVYTIKFDDSINKGMFPESELDFN